MKLFTRRNLGAFLIALAGLILQVLFTLGFSQLGTDNTPAEDITFITAFFWVSLTTDTLIIIVVLIITGYHMIIDKRSNY
jgi:chromate transport protein ChrA